MLLLAPDWRTETNTPILTHQRGALGFEGERLVVRIAAPRFDWNTMPHEG